MPAIPDCQCQSLGQAAETSRWAGWAARNEPLKSHHCCRHLTGLSHPRLLRSPVLAQSPSASLAQLGAGAGMLFGLPAEGPAPHSCMAARLHMWCCLLAWLVAGNSLCVAPMRPPRATVDKGLVQTSIALECGGLNARPSEGQSSSSSSARCHWVMRLVGLQREVASNTYLRVRSRWYCKSVSFACCIWRLLIARLYFRGGLQSTTNHVSKSSQQGVWPDKVQPLLCTWSWSACGIGSAHWQTKAAALCACPRCTGL